MKVQEKDIKKLANKMLDYISHKGMKAINFSKKEMFIITETRFMYLTNDEMKQDKLCEYMFNLTTQVFDKMTRDIEKVMQDIKRERLD